MGVDSQGPEAHDPAAELGLGVFINTVSINTRVDENIIPVTSRMPRET
jgi:hypothetical protein